MSLSSTRFMPAAPSGLARPVRSATYQRLAAARHGGAARVRATVLATRSPLWVRALRCVGLSD